MANWASFFFSPLFFIYTYTFCTYPEMRAAFWLLGGAYGRSSNLYWVLSPTLFCTCSCHHTHTHAHAHVHTCTHTLSYTYTHATPAVACMYRPFSVVLTSNLHQCNRNAYNCVYFDDIISLIYAALHDSSSQWWSLVWTTNSKRST